MSVASAKTTQVGPQVGYRSLHQELDHAALPVEGNLPAWLAGSLLRNGPALFEGGERSVRHWFDGQAMLHRFTLAAGQVSYANRFLQTKAYRSMRDEGRISYSEFATDPCRSIFKRAMTLFDPQVTDNTAVSVVKLGEQHHAMTEAPMSVQFDPQTLETLGYGQRCPGTFATAHPHQDPRTGAMINVATRMGPHNSYRFFAHEPDGRSRTLAAKGVRRPGYVHSFAMSEHYVALLEFPFLVNPVEIPLSGRPFIENFRWLPERGTRILVFDRSSGRSAGVFETEPGFAFHHVGAWEQGDKLVMEYCEHETPRVIDAFYLDRLRDPSPATTPEPLQPRLRRLTVNLRRGSVHAEYRSDQTLELPRTNEQATYLKPHRYVYGVATDPGSGYDTANRLVKVDSETGDASTWVEHDCYVGEPVFVPRPGAQREDDGVVLSVLLDARQEHSSLLVLDAGTLTEVARARAPHLIPHGIHGAFHPAP